MQLRERPAPRPQLIAAAAGSRVSSDPPNTGHGAALQAPLSPPNGASGHLRSQGSSHGAHHGHHAAVGDVPLCDRCLQPIDADMFAASVDRLQVLAWPPNHPNYSTVPNHMQCPCQPSGRPGISTATCLLLFASSSMGQGVRVRASDVAACAAVPVCGRQCTRHVTANHRAVAGLLSKHSQPVASGRRTGCIERAIMTPDVSDC